MKEQSEDIALPTVIEAQPADLVAYASKAAVATRAIVEQTAQQIGPKRYIRVEGWQALALAHGCVTSSRYVQRVEGGVTAIGEVRRRDTGAVVAEAEGFVGDDEPTWSKRPEFARRAMAQTRAISRACRAAFAHVVVMMAAGLETTPAEEMESIETSLQPKVIPPAKQKTISLPPVDSEYTIGVLEKLSIKEGTKKDGSVFVRYGALILGEWYGTFDSGLGQQLAELEGQHVRLGWKREGKFRTATSVQPYSEAADEDEAGTLPPELEDERLL